MSERMRIAIPVESGEGLDGIRSAHFGHAPAFALVDVENGAPVSVEMLANPPHTHGGCGMTVSLLVSSGVDSVSVIGMGRGPLNGLLANGVSVHHDAGSSTVREAVQAVIEGRTSTFGAQHACQGHH